MANISSKDISSLREISGAGMVDCKKALQESAGNLEEAVKILRQKGLASAAKKMGKVATEGAVISAINGSATKGIILELNSQTDFVAKNEKFQSLLNELVKVVLDNEIKDLSSLKKFKLIGGETIEELISLTTSEIGEKLDLRRLEIYEASTGEYITQYTHPVGSKIGVLAKFKGEDQSVGKDICMHIAASQPAPEFLFENSIPESLVEKEKKIEAGKEDLKGKPADIIDKIVQGRVNKVLIQKVLYKQSFIKDSSLTVENYLDQNKTEVKAFIRFDLGEGIEKKETNFADEVAAQINR